MTGGLDGKVAFITGAARGQGRAHAIRLAEAGAHIIGIDICAPIDIVDYALASPQDLAETVALVEKNGGRMVAGPADVRDPESMARVLELGRQEFGRLDFVLANAGVMPIFGDKAATMTAWNVCIDVMLTGVLNTIELTYPVIRSQGSGGSIVITSSMAALKPMMRTEGAHTLGMLGYGAAKLGLVSLARNYASLLGPDNIRVNTIHPSGVDTDMINNEVTAAYWERSHEQDRLTLVPAMAIGRLQPEDIANAAYWLCSDDSRFYTGNTMRVDAGCSLR